MWVRFPPRQLINKNTKMEITTQGILSLFETTKLQRSIFVTDVLNRIYNGTADPIKVHLQLKAMEEIVKTLNNDPNYKEHLLDAVSKEGKKFVKFNAEFSIKEMGTKYDYSQCGDTDLLAMLQSIETISEAVKERQTFLKGIPAAGVQQIDANGEVITLYPPTKTSSTTVAVSLK